MTFKNTSSVVEPVTTPGGQHSDSVTTHPSFGQISICRQSGRGALYGSDFIHHNCITLEITTSELHRSLSNDRHFSRDTLVKVAMSEAQFATLMSGVNTGGGVPCTIQRDQNGMVPSLPNPKPRTEQFSAELRKSMARADEAAAELAQKLEGMGLSKKKLDDLLRDVSGIRRMIDGSVEFVADQFDEHMENTVEAAKVEVAGYTNALAHRMGVAAIASADPIMLPGRNDDAEPV